MRAQGFWRPGVDHVAQTFWGPEGDFSGSLWFLVCYRPWRGRRQSVVGQQVRMTAPGAPVPDWGGLWRPSEGSVIKPRLPPPLPGSWCACPILGMRHQRRSPNKSCMRDLKCLRNHLSRRPSSRARGCCRSLPVIVSRFHWWPWLFLGPELRSMCPVEGGVDSRFEGSRKLEQGSGWPSMTSLSITWLKTAFPYSCAATPTSDDRLPQCLSVSHKDEHAAASLEWMTLEISGKVYISNRLETHPFHMEPGT